MGYIDYIVAAFPFILLIVSVIAGKVRGFAEIVISAAFVIVCMIAARQYISPAAQMLNDRFVHEKLVSHLAEVIGRNAGAGGESLMNSLPAYLSELLESAGVTAESISSSIDPAGISEKIAPPLEKSIILPALTSALYVLVYVFARIAGRVVSSLVGVIAKLPVIKQVNGLLGAVLGVITGSIAAALSVLIMFAAAGFLPETEFARAVNNSAVLGGIHELLGNILH